MAIRGRPVRSEIRQNIIEILFYLEKGYGYQIAKLYKEIFPPVSQRLIYYHLRKGVKTKEIERDKIETEKGEFSWGNSVEKVYYTLGSRAEPKGLERVKIVVKGIVGGVERKELEEKEKKELNKEEVVEEETNKEKKDIIKTENKIKSRLNKLMGKFKR